VAARRRPAYHPSNRPRSSRPARRPRYGGGPLPQLFFSSDGDEFNEDGTRYNPLVVSLIRDEWIHGQMQQR
jgi:hypothetical protein